jgi:hypothetical protein
VLGDDANRSGYDSPRLVRCGTRNPAAVDDAMLIADYIAISVLIVLTLWAGAERTDEHCLDKQLHKSPHRPDNQNRGLRPQGIARVFLLLFLFGRQT